MVLRVPRAFSVRARNHCAKALFFLEHEQPLRQLNHASSNPSIAVPIHLARLMLGARQPKHRPDGLGFAEASRNVDGGAIGQRHHGANAGGRHQAPAHLVIPDNGQQTAMQDDDLFP